MNPITLDVTLMFLPFLSINVNLHQLSVKCLITKLYCMSNAPLAAHGLQQLTGSTGRARVTECTLRCAQHLCLGLLGMIAELVYICDAPARDAE